MFAESNPPKDSTSKSLDLENQDQRSHLFRDGGDPGPKSGTSIPQELTLSYLCENPKLGLQEKELPLEKSRSKGKEIVAESSAQEERRWIEMDFFQLAGRKREGLEGLEADGREKKVKMETLNLSLAPPNLSLSLTSSNPVGPSAAAPRPAAPSSVPAKRAYSADTRTTNSNDFAASLSYTYSVPFSHNPSCSLTRNSTENYEASRENDHIWHAGEGTNGSVHSRFKPVGDGNSIAFANPGGHPQMQGGNNKELNNSFYRGSGSENISFFPSELPARPPRVNGVASSDSGKNLMLTRPDRVLREIVSESVPAIAQILEDFASESLETLKGYLRNLMEAPEKKDEFASLQRKLERRSDLTFETLSKSHKTQLEIMVAIKTGIVNFVSGKNRIPSTELVEIFLLMRCRNVNCNSILPVDDCNCKICSTKKGFCSSCMCPVCLKFDCASNTCSWVGCDVCSHWCHAVCGLEKNLIRPGPTLKGSMGTTEMQFLCLGCGHASEMFGFVKEVFNLCAKEWSLETLMKELDCVRKIFHASEDFEGKGLHAKAEEILRNLSKKQISPSDACNSMLHFFRYGVTEFSVTGSTSKNAVTAQVSQLTDMLPCSSPTTSTPANAFDFKTTSAMLDTKTDALKAAPNFTPSKEDDFQNLETIVKLKEAEAKLFQRLADDARREVEGYRQIVRAKTEKLEEEYSSKLAKLCIQEMEGKRKKKLEELKLLENSHCDYHKMKLRMQAEIASLLERMEATKKMWV
ncbi:protein TITANIA-like [Typha angustifolia]|uniref:protein TITANIA-like n=1 Tax=Typha angustifolia TaxID=59011 RepID=UPI003C2F97A7